LQQADGLVLPHPRFKPEHHVANPVGRVTGCVLEHGELVELVDHAKPVGCSGEDVSRILGGAGMLDGCPHAVHDERRHLDHGTIGELLPSDHADPRSCADPFVGEDLAERA
jgi:hypothetical protein